MLCAAARSGHGEVVELLLAFSTWQRVSVDEMVAMDTMMVPLEYDGNKGNLASTESD